MNFCIPNEKQLNQFHTYAKQLVREYQSLPEAQHKIEEVVGANTKNKDLAKLYSDTLASQWDNIKQQVNGSITADLVQDGFITSNRTVTEQENLKAKEWFESSPISKYINYTNLHQIVNCDAFATWTTHGITLYRGAEYSDLYHEAFHGFSQMFLTTEQKRDLYGEVAKLHPGLTNLEAEEMLAEDFKQYVLTGSKQVFRGEPKKQSLFRKIYNFLRSLFGNKSYQELLQEDMARTSLKDIYDNLYLGKIYKYSPSVTNVMFSKLNSGIKTIDGSQELSFAESKHISNTIDAMILEILKATGDSLSILKHKVSQRDVYRMVKEFAIPALREQGAANSGFKGDDLKRMHRLIDFMDANWPKAVRFHGQHSIMFTVNSIKPIEIDSEGNIDIVADDTEGKDDSRDSSQTRDSAFDRSGTENPLSSIDGDIRILLSTQAKYDKEGNIVVNPLGMNEFESFDKVWNTLVNSLVDQTASYDEMLGKMNKLSSEIPFIRDLIVDLGEPQTTARSSQEIARHQMQTKFAQTFNKKRVPLIKLSIEKEGTNGLRYQFTAIDSRAQVIRDKWTSNFQQRSPEKDPWVKENAQGEIELDTAKYLKPTGLKTRVARLGSMGFVFSNPEAAEVDLEENWNKMRGSSASTDISSFIQSVAFYNKEHPTTPISITDPVTQLKSGFPKQGIKGVSSAVDFLIEVEKKYNKDIPNMMQTNAEGKLESEVMLTNFMNSVVSAINNTEKYPTYKDFITDPFNQDLALKFNPDLNPHVRHSQWLNRLFILDVSMDDPTYGQRRVDVRTKLPVQMEMVNYNGVQFRENGTTQALKTTKLDGVSKYYMDFNNFLTYGIMEVIRHGSKSSAFAFRVINGKALTENIPLRKVVDLGSYERFYEESDSNHKDLEPYTSPGRFLYAPFQDFLKYNKDANFGFNFKSDGKAFQIVQGYIQDELDRIKSFNDGVGTEFQKYSKNAGSFTIFDDILGSELKNKLIKRGSTEGFEGEIIQDLNNYFNNLYKRDSDYIYENRHKFTNEGVFKNLLFNDDRWNFDQKFKLALATYVFNSWVHQNEAFKFIYGDPAFFKDADDLFKRVTTYSATGDMQRDDKSHRDFLNDLSDDFSKKRMKELKVEDWQSRPSDGTIHTAIFKDQNVSISPEDKQEVLAAFVEAGYDLKEAEAVLDPYNKMTEADGQGLITFDAYRRIMLSIGQWSDLMENRYQNEVAGTKFPESAMAQFFPPLKPQYCGPLQTNILNATAMHKFSLMPMIPSLIKGTNMEHIHDRMIFNHIDYGVFESGSKGNDYGAESIYSKGRAVEDFKTPFTPNPIFSKYFKQQVKMHEEFHDKVIFSTQQRKLIFSGLFENGEAITPEAKAFTDRFENLVNQYSQNLKQGLMRKLGIGYKDGKYIIGDYTPLVKELQKQLKTRNLPDHVIRFVDINKEGKLIHPLDTSTHVQKIENTLMAIVNNKLITQKNFGEALVQVASTGFEKYREATEAEKEQYTNDLPFYKPGARTLPDGTRVTSAMKVKIAMTDNYRKLLEHTDTEGKKIKTVERLNELLKDDDWLNTGDNRKMVTMTAVRIPVQGLNSMEFMEVYEFLPQSAGLAIILPTQIVAKSGGDFDIDKLTVLHPQLYKDFGGTVHYLSGKDGSYEHFRELANQKFYNEKVLKPDGAYEYQKKLQLAIRSLFQNLDLSKDLDKFIEKNSKIIDSYAANINSEEDFSKVWSAIQNKLLEIYTNAKKFQNVNLAAELQESFEHEFKAQAIQNDLITTIRDILQMKDNFTSLFRPNDTSLVKGEADLRNGKIGYNSKQSVSDPAKVASKTSFSRVVENGMNIYKHVSNGVGKTTLGIGAVANTLKSLLNRVGAYMMPNTTELDDGVETVIDFEENLLYGEDPNTKKYTTKLVPKTKSIDLRKILFKHNTVEKDGTSYASFAGLKDANGENDLREIISQLMNGWVDVEKDAWIFNINGNNIAGPIILFLNHLGVPFKDITSFVTDPLILKYVEALNSQESPFLKASQSDFENKSYKWIKASELLGTKVNKKNFPTLKAGIYNNISDITTANSKQKLFYFMMLQEMSDELRSVQGAINFDTSKSAEAFASYKKLSDAEEIRNSTFMPKEVIDKLLDESIVSPFKEAAKLGVSMTESMLPIRSSQPVNESAMDLVNTVSRGKSLAPKLSRAFKNDLILATLQNAAIEGTKFEDNKWAKKIGNTDNIMDDYDALMKEFPSLKEDFVVTNIFTRSRSKKNAKLNNIRVRQGAITESNQSDLYEEMEHLINPSYTKVSDPEANNRISQFFKDIATIGLLQSGVSKSPISYLDIIPDSVYLDLLTPVMGQFVKLATDPQELSSFQNRFMQVNTIAGAKLGWEDYRYKDYANLYSTPEIEANSIPEDIQSVLSNIEEDETSDEVPPCAG